MNKKLQTIGWVDLFALTAALLLALSGLAISKPGAEESRVIPAPALDEQAKPDSREEVAVLAGGCFWGVQGVFQHLKGVRNAVSGYAGGNKQTARYDMVGLGNTGHAEAVRITYDPKEISYGRLLQIYFSVAHNPTELNRQGPDIGTQYRSAIFPMDDEQAKIAKAYIGELNRAPRRWIGLQDDAGSSVLSGRELSPGLHGPEPELPLHRDPRPAEAREPEAAVPGSLPRRAGARLCASLELRTRQAAHAALVP